MRCLGDDDVTIEQMSQAVFSASPLGDYISRPTKLKQLVLESDSERKGISAGMNHSAGSLVCSSEKTVAVSVSVCNGSA
jgi:hypothetical protein